jgi:hypothetical protein
LGEGGDILGARKKADWKTAANQGKMGLTVGNIREEEKRLCSSCQILAFRPKKNGWFRYGTVVSKYRYLNSYIR